MKLCLKTKGRFFRTRDSLGLSMRLFAAVQCSGSLLTTRKRWKMQGKIWLAHPNTLPTTIHQGSVEAKVRLMKRDGKSIPWYCTELKEGMRFEPRSGSTSRSSSLSFLPFHERWNTVALQHWYCFLKILFKFLKFIFSCAKTRLWWNLQLKGVGLEGDCCYCYFRTY